jgi:hypothetical protein
MPNHTTNPSASEGGGRFTAKTRQPTFSVMKIMPKPPKDLVKKVDWLYEHLSINLETNPNAKCGWQVMIHFPNMLSMQRATRRIRKSGYIVVTQEHYEETTVTGRKQVVRDLGPTAMVYKVGAFKAPAVKDYVREMLSLAKEFDAKCSDLDHWSMDDLEMVYGPPMLLKSLKSAQWRLHHYTDTGLAEGAPMVYVFGFAAASPAEAIATLKSAGVKKARRGPRDADWTVESRVLGSNDDAKLAEAFKVAMKHAKLIGCKLVGVEFEEP